MKSHSEAALTQKFMNFKVKVTTYLKGTRKNAFFLDCVKRGTYEGDLMRNIIDVHYHILSLRPEYKEKEFSELKTLLTEKLKK